MKKESLTLPEVYSYFKQNTPKISCKYTEGYMASGYLVFVDERDYDGAYKILNKNASCKNNFNLFIIFESTRRGTPEIKYITFNCMKNMDYSIFDKNTTSHFGDNYLLADGRFKILPEKLFTIPKNPGSIHNRYAKEIDMFLTFLNKIYHVCPLYASPNSPMVSEEELKNI